MGKPKKFDFAKAKEEETILTGLVKMAQKNTATDEDMNLVIEYHGQKVVIEKSEVEPLPYNQSIVRYVGGEIKFIVIEYEPTLNLIFGSNKKAIAKEKKPILEKLKNGESLTGYIIKIFPHGAYVSIGTSGTVTGLLKNVNYSNDGTTIMERCREGEPIKVKFLRYSGKGTILLETPEKISSKSAFSLDDYDRGQIVYGKVVKLCVDKIFVNIATGLDAMCCIPDTVTGLTEGDMVAIRIIKVDREMKRVRAVITTKM